MKEEIYGEHEESEAKKQEIAKMYNEIIKFSQGNNPPNKLDFDIFIFLFSFNTFEIKYDSSFY